MRKGFTLIELLVVIAIIAILAVVVVLTLNPAELLRQSRDSNRVSDMSTLNAAINLYSTDQGGSSGYSLGTPDTVYVSLPDPNATTTAGSNCSSLGLPTLPSTYTYHCAGPNYYRDINGTGWIPINFSTMSTDAPMSDLPVDPTNTSSSRLYYTYTTDGSHFETTAVMESQKYGVGGSNDQISGDGGPLATVYEKGSKLGLEPLDYGDPSLVGYWPLDEGAGTVAYDWSGNNNTGTWNGTQAGTSGYYSPGKVEPWAGTFDGSTDGINATLSTPLATSSPYTVILWFNPSSPQVAAYPFLLSIGNSSLYFSFAGTPIGNLTPPFAFSYGPSDYFTGTYALENSWHQFAQVLTGTEMTLYIDGVAEDTVPFTSVAISNIEIGAFGGNDFAGLMGDVRIYNRALSASEIAAMYAGGK